jgi:hypothetical protein
MRGKLRHPLIATRPHANGPSTLSRGNRESCEVGKKLDDEGFFVRLCKRELLMFGSP